MKAAGYGVTQSTSATLSVLRISRTWSLTNKHYEFGLSMGISVNTAFVLAARRTRLAARCERGPYFLHIGRSGCSEIAGLPSTGAHSVATTPIYFTPETDLHTATTDMPRYTTRGLETPRDPHRAHLHYADNMSVRRRNERHNHRSLRCHRSGSLKCPALIHPIAPPLGARTFGGG